eukprot:TRINITY_DN13217_c0_g1_i1.p1 TRINITY_DN13217_c0_g1~~TRINITY_DN13217_c0_g1_i1.p1  ORF type:complete len:173 (-),score=25.16 TRINITY_DN13217_c0_g1_i1:238-756(-)
MALNETSTSVATTDLCDAHEEKLQAGDLRVLCPPGLLQPYGMLRSFAGPSTTLKVFEDNSLVRDALEQPGEGRVLVVDGGGSTRCALLGGNLAQLAEKNKWSGVIVFGCIRDVDEIAECKIGVRALGTHPRKSMKRGAGDKDVAISFGGTTIRPGEFVYADGDGVLVSRSKL